MPLAMLGLENTIPHSFTPTQVFTRTRAQANGTALLAIRHRKKILHVHFRFRHSFVEFSLFIHVISRSV